MSARDPGVVDATRLGIPETFNAATYFVDRHVEEGRGDRVAIECGDARVTYRDVLERVNRLGSALRERLRLRPEERIALQLVDGWEFACVFFGAIKAGIVPVPVNTLWKPTDLEYALNDSRARVVVISEPMLGQFQTIPRERVPHLEEVVVVGSAPHGTRALASLLDEGSPEFGAEPTSRDAPAFWLYSSGSTGPPKACVHLQHDMVICAELYAKGVLGLTGTDRCFSVAKLFFAYGLGNGLYFPFAVGATSILWPGPPTAANVYAVVERYRPTLLFSVPTGYGMLLSHRRQDGPDFDLSSVRLAVSAGEALPPALLERFTQRFGVDILDGIGSTEVLHIFISNHPGEIRPGSSGRLVRGYAARLLDEEGRPVPTGDIGNLLVSGDSTCACYWNKHEKTKDAIAGHWIRTGDKYIQDADGFFWHAGRSDDMLKVGGMWVSPVEVENAIVEHPAVQECAVVGGEDHDGLVKPVAFVVLSSEVAATSAFAADLQRFVGDRLPGHMRPRWVRFLPELPKTATGKVQRFRLRALWTEDRREDPSRS